MNIQELKYYYLRNLFGIDDIDEFNEWLTEVISSDDNFPQEVYPHINFKKDDNYNTVLNILIQYYVPQFKTSDPSNHELVRKIAIEYSELFLNKRISPLEFCCLIRSIDAIMMDTDFEENETNPINLIGDLWNACDWCDESWTHDSDPHLVDAVKSNLKSLSG